MHFGNMWGIGFGSERGENNSLLQVLLAWDLSTSQSITLHFLVELQFGGDLCGVEIYSA